MSNIYLDKKKSLFSQGDSVLIKDVELNVMEHLIGKIYCITEIIQSKFNASTTSRYIGVSAPMYPDSKSERVWYFSENEVLKLQSEDYFKHKKEMLDQRLIELKKDFASFEKELLEYKKNT